jgi:hypothetical protein
MIVPQMPLSNWALLLLSEDELRGTDVVSNVVLLRLEYVVVVIGAAMVPSVDFWSVASASAHLHSVTQPVTSTVLMYSGQLVERRGHDGFGQHTLVGEV